MKRILKVGFMLTMAAFLLSSCNCYTKMVNKMNDVSATCNPEILSLKGSSIPADIKVEFPKKYFKKKATLRVTPILVCSDGTQIASTPKYLQGERVKDNFQVINYKAGGNYTQQISIPYEKRARVSSLELRFEAKCKNGEFKVISSVEIAKGVSTIQLMADYSAGMTIMADNFKRVTTITEDASIMYLVNRSEVRKTELTRSEIALFEAFVKENATKDRSTLGSIAAKGYASPEGPVTVNDKLASERSQSGKDAISTQLSGVNAKYDISAYGEDWEGFQKLVSESNIKEKDLILQVLSMYSNPVKRDEEIRNMASVYNVLKDNILPQLRRTQLVANVDIEGRTDNEIKAALNNNISALSVEELLYAATLVDDSASKVKAYQTAATKFNCPRGYNNLGVTYAKEGKLDEAKKAFDKAASLSNSPDITNNLGVLALINGDVATAKRMIAPLNTPDARANMAGIINLAEGKYVEAARSLKGYNLAVAQVLDENYGDAKALLAKENSANADYLKAVIAIREGNVNAAQSNLNSAFAKDASLKECAKTDVEFIKIYGATDYLAL